MELRNEPEWIPGVILKKLRIRPYLVKVTDGAESRRHVDHIPQRIAREEEGLTSETDTPVLEPQLIFLSLPSPLEGPPSVSPDDGVEQRTCHRTQNISRQDKSTGGWNIRSPKDRVEPATTESCDNARMAPATPKRQGQPAEPYVYCVEH